MHAECVATRGNVRGAALMRGRARGRRDKAAPAPLKSKDPFSSAGGTEALNLGVEILFSAEKKRLWSGKAAFWLQCGWGYEFVLWGRCICVIRSLWPLEEEKSGQFSSKENKHLGRKGKCNLLFVVYCRTVIWDDMCVFVKKRDS